MRLITFLIACYAVFAFCEVQQHEEIMNLVPNGNFDADPKILVGWDPLPDDGTVKWIFLDKEHGKVVAFKLSKEIAESTGILFYSKYIPVKEGKKYKLSFDYKSTGPKPKPFVKGYGLFPDAYGKIEPRELYKKSFFENTVSNEWKTLTIEFTPHNPIYKSKYEIKWVKVLLYAYFKQGEIYFDNIKIVEAE